MQHIISMKVVVQRLLLSAYLLDSHIRLGIFIVNHTKVSKEKQIFSNAMHTYTVEKDSDCLESERQP